MLWMITAGIYNFETGRVSPKSDIVQSDPSTFDYTLLPAALNNRLWNEELSNTRFFFSFPDGFKFTIIILNAL